VLQAGGAARLLPEDDGRLGPPDPPAGSQRVGAEGERAAPRGGWADGAMSGAWHGVPARQRPFPTWVCVRGGDARTAAPQAWRNGGTGAAAPFWVTRCSREGSLGTLRRSRALPYGAGLSACELGAATPGFTDTLSCEKRQSCRLGRGMGPAEGNSRTCSHWVLLPAQSSGEWETKGVC